MKYLLLQPNGIADVFETPWILTKAALENLVGGLVDHVCLDDNSGLCAVYNCMQFSKLPPPMPLNPFFTTLKGNVVIAKFKDGAFQGLSNADMNRIQLPHGCELRRSPMPPPLNYIS